MAGPSGQPASSHRQEVIAAVFSRVYLVQVSLYFDRNVFILSNYAAVMP